MRIRVTHRTHYQYDRPVFLEPHVFRLTPRQDAAQHLLEHSITLSPPAAGMTPMIDIDGGDALTAWFSGLQESLIIDTVSVVETRRENAFDFLITHAPTASLPARYPAPLQTALAPWLGGHDATSDVRIWSDMLSERARKSTLSFLTHLTEDLHARTDVIDRPDGDPYTPQQTFEGKSGSCRDLAMLFVAACHVQGLAARFVSGYSTHHPPSTVRHELHAWAEVYLPGGGWRAFDPSLGLAVADGHVALASGPDHVLAAPLSGTYRGTGASARLTYDITISSGG